MHFALLCPAVGQCFRIFPSSAKHEELESLRSGTEVLVLVLVRQGHSKLDARRGGFFLAIFLNAVNC